ncbi:MAG: response regulator [Burkholderiaceae bacterium]
MATVLVVEDEFGIADLLDSVLTEEGYRVFTAMNGQEGLELAVREHPSLIISDYMMPVMDGATMLVRINADPALQSTLVVMMSSMPEATVAERCTGYETFLRKPFNLFEVVDLVQRLIGRPDEAA